MIFTFYSYKGGVGRSMALANIAELFYSLGLRVVMVDWDLEAPGLERFFFSEDLLEEKLAQPGLLDMFLAYKEILTKEWPDEGDLPLPHPKDYALTVYTQTKSKSQNSKRNSGLSLLTSGQRSSTHFSRYAQEVINFDWQDFYQNWEGERYVEWLKLRLGEMADVILIDSRTGVTEMGGICTYQLADMVVMFCAPNQQNLTGTYEMAKGLLDPSVKEIRKGKAIQLAIIPTRIERAEGDLQDEFQVNFIKTLSPLFADLETDVNEFWGLNIPYIPKYAYQEKIAFREEGRASATDMVIAFRILGNYLASFLPKATTTRLDLSFLDSDLSISDELSVTRRNYNKAGTLLSEAKQLLNSDEIDTIQVSLLLDQAQSLAPDHSEIPKLRQHLHELKDKQRERQLYKETLQKCQNLWDREQELVRAQVASSEILETCYSSAVHLAKDAASNFPNSPLLSGLIRQTELAFDQARTRYEVRSTAEATGDFKSLIKSLGEEKDKSKLIPWRNLKGEEQEPIPISEAITAAKILAVNYAEQKAMQYIQQARQFMTAHAPRAAKNELSRIDDLFMLDDESRGIAMHYLINTVEPEIARLEKAELILRQASIANSAELSWRLVNEALEIYPHLPDVTTIRQSLLPRMVTAVERRLSDSRAALQQGDVQTALTSASEAVRWSKLLVQHSANQDMQELEGNSRALQAQAEELEALSEQLTKLTSDLQELSKNNPDPDELDKLVVKLKQLPEPQPVDVIYKAQAVSAEYRARRHERLNEWSEAMKYWEIALDLEPFNPDYKLRKQKALKKTAEIELAKEENHPAINAILEKLVSDLPLDPEVRFWQARYYFDRASRRGLSIRDKRNDYALALDALMAVRDVLSRIIEPDGSLPSKVTDLYSEVMAADGLAQQQQEIERKLAMHERRSHQEVERAKKDAHRLVTEFKGNTAVADWWQRTRDQAIEQLVKADAELAQREIWERFSIRSKILVLNADHVLAQLFLRELPNHAEDMKLRIERLVNDREGHTMIDDERVVEEQLVMVETAQADARAIYDMLRSFKEQIPGYLEEHVNTLRMGLEHLNRYISELEDLRQSTAKAITYLNQAKVDGNWQNFDTIMRQINMAGFNNHRTMRALRQKQDTIQVRRGELLKLQGELVELAETERFQPALRIINVLETDPELGDPTDEYMLRTTIRVIDPVTQNTITNWRILKNWLTERQQQLQQAADWLMNAGLVAVLDGYEVFHPPLADYQPDRIVDWPEVRVDIIKLTEMGNFDGAESELHRAVAGECMPEKDGEEAGGSKRIKLGDCPRSGWHDRARKVLALEESVNRLRKPPITMEQANSRRVKELIRAAYIQLDNLEPHLSQAERNLATIYKKRDEWKLAYSELETALRELADTSGLFSRWRNKEAQLAARQKVYEGLQVCSVIAPYHPVLADVRGNPLIRD